MAAHSSTVTSPQLSTGPSPHTFPSSAPPSSPFTSSTTPPAPNSPHWLGSEDIDPNLFQPLYSGAEITLCGAVCAIMQFCLRHKLSYTAIGDLLKLLLLICPVSNKLPTSFYKFKKFFQKFNSVISHETVCGTCQLKDCSCDSPSSVASGHLVELPIHKPLQTILSSKYMHLNLILCEN